jgi:hypothetical protein
MEIFEVPQIIIQVSHHVNTDASILFLSILLYFFYFPRIVSPKAKNYISSVDISRRPIPMACSLPSAWMAA